MKLVSVTDPGTEEGFHGLIQNFGYSCAFFGVESNVALAWIPASYSHQGSLAASYLIDREAQVYGNIMDLESREPSLINGAGVGVDAQDLTRLPVDGQTRSIAKDDRYMKVENIDMGYSVDDMMFGISVLINVRFTGFPKVSQGYVTFLVLESDKRFEFQIDKSGWIRVKIDDAADIYMDSGYDAYYDFEIAMKLYVGKIKHMNKGIAEIYYTADSYGSYGFAQHGQFFDCKNFDLFCRGQGRGQPRSKAGEHLDCNAGKPEQRCLPDEDACKHVEYFQFQCLGEGERWRPERGHLREPC